MSITDISNSTMGALSATLDALLFATSANDLCRSVVHGGFTGVETHGCHIYVLDHNSNLKQVAGYGLAHADVVEELSAWDNSPAAECIRQKDLVFKAATKETGRSLICIPFLKDSIPVGCVCLTVSDGVNGVPEIPGLLTIVSKLGALYLESSGVKTSGRKDASSSTNGEDLTKRQIQILEMMSDGMSNVEIAREMLLSESSIRQETVRIYRALGVAAAPRHLRRQRLWALFQKADLLLLRK